MRSLDDKSHRNGTVLVYRVKYNFVREHLPSLNTPTLIYAISAFSVKEHDIDSIAWQKVLIISKFEPVALYSSDQPPNH